MDFNNKKNIIIGSTLLFVFLLVVFNLELFTGNAGKVVVVTSYTEKGFTTVEVIPSSIDAGGYINVHVTPGSKCVERKVWIYKEGDNHAVASFQRTQWTLREGYKICKPAVLSYKSWSTWHGDYYVLVKDIASNQYVKAPFFIE